jgi:hypothetical protein
MARRDLPIRVEHTVRSAVVGIAPALEEAEGVGGRQALETHQLPRCRRVVEADGR